LNNKVPGKYETEIEDITFGPAWRTLEITREEGAIDD
jgi:hypothetical protein